MRPDVVVVTNLFRDQLDRYGEVDAVAAIWRDGAGRADRAAGVTTLALNADDPTVAALGHARRERGAPTSASTTPAGATPAWSTPPTPRSAPPAAPCWSTPSCYYGHLGHYRCPNGHARPRAGRAGHPRWSRRASTAPT